MSTPNITPNEASQFGVPDHAFWHNNMLLYCGYQTGEIVEVQHESNKYWLATIEFSLEHLVLLKWIGDYGEFWLDTCPQNQITETQKRLYPLGYHMQSQPKSQFVLERPTKILVKPSLYNPESDPYAEVKTVNDLLAHEVDQSNDDTFGNQESTVTVEHSGANLALAKCKTKVSYGQEDVDELEAALQNLNEIESERVGTLNESPDHFNLNSSVPTQLATIETEANDGSDNIARSYSNNIEFEPNFTESKVPVTTSVVGDKDDLLNPLYTVEKESEKSRKTSNQLMTNGKKVTKSNNEASPEPDIDHKFFIDLCKSLQDSAITKGRYVGIGKNGQKVYFSKPKLLFDIGGANHKRVFLPGTLLEVCHTLEGESGLELYHWFATVLSNEGGRLRLRWFLCDEPKFKQGRLEPKSSRSNYVSEEEEEEEEEEDEEEEDGENPESKGKSENMNCLKTKSRIPTKDITFSMHFCNPCLHTISHAKTHERAYKMPIKLRSYFKSADAAIESLGEIEQQQMEFIFDLRRMNLDKDRPLVNHLLSTVRFTKPKYLNLIFAPKDKESRREVLLSTPRTTKLVKGFVRRELEPGVFEIHSEPLPDNGEIIKFIYPYDSSFAILPLDWAENNQDCLSINPSRNPTPIPVEKSTNSSSSNESIIRSSIESSNESTKTAQLCHDLSFPAQSSANNLVAATTCSSYEQAEVRPPFTLMCEIKPFPSESPKNNDNEANIVGQADENFDELDPSCWSRLIRTRELEATEFQCNIDYSSMASVSSEFKVMNQLEVVHPGSDVTFCSGRIRKVVFPLLWIQLSPDSYTLLPFNSTDIYPVKWCDQYNFPLISLLPPRKRLSPSSPLPDKKRKRVKNNDDISDDQEDLGLTLLDPDNGHKVEFEKEEFDLGTLNNNQMEIDYILNEKSMYIKIYFNHKCFTGPSLSKGKICSLPQYVGPGPLRLVIEEVVTKVISVAYVPPRILNDLSSKSFEELLIARNLTNTALMEFKAKYQKRVHREGIPVCLNPDDVALYCECICEHLKCCYNLFGPNLYDGDDCPGHCRALTKSNKFMKRATYYREKARLGEFMNNSDNSSNKKSSSNASCTNSNIKSSRPRYAGRGSSESTSSTISRSEQLNSRASSTGDEAPINDLKENLVAVEEIDNEEFEECMNDEAKDCVKLAEEKICPIVEDDVALPAVDVVTEPEMDKILYQQQTRQQEQSRSHSNLLNRKLSPKWQSEFSSEFNMFDVQKLRPEDWTVEDVAEHLEWCRLGRFKPHMLSEGVDGQALLLLDKSAISEHFQHQSRRDYTQEEVGKLCRFVEFLKAHAEATT